MWIFGLLFVWLSSSQPRLAQAQLRKGGARPFNPQSSNAAGNSFQKTKTMMLSNAEVTPSRGDCIAVVNVATNVEEPTGGKTKYTLRCESLLDGTTLGFDGGVDDEWLEAKIQNLELQSGSTVIDLEGHGPKNGKDKRAHYKQGERPKLLGGGSRRSGRAFSGRPHGPQRMLAAPTNPTVLVVRAVTLDGVACPYTESELADNAFTDSVNLVTQYESCSNGTVNFQEAPNRAKLAGVAAPATDIVDGVTTVEVNAFSTSTIAKEDFQDLVTAALEANFGVSIPTDLADHVMMCLPSYSGWSSGGAYAGIGTWYSVYSDTSVSSLSTNMHELGHNLGLYHSGEGGSSYGDTSGYMGSSLSGDDTPQQCFNGAKYWQLGWLTGTGTLGAAVEWNGMATFTKIEGIIEPWANGVPKVIKIADYSDFDQANHRDYFVYYNRQDDFNIGTREDGDAVIVLSQAPLGESLKLAALSTNGATYTISSGGLSSCPVTIKVEDITSNTDQPVISLCDCNDCPASDPSPGTCGDGVLDTPGETCDSFSTCEDFGKAGGPLTCSGNCSMVDTSDCFTMEYEVNPLTMSSNSYYPGPSSSNVITIPITSAVEFLRFEFSPGIRKDNSDGSVTSVAVMATKLNGNAYPWNSASYDSRIWAFGRPGELAYYEYGNLVAGDYVTVIIYAFGDPLTDAHLRVISGPLQDPTPAPAPTTEPPTSQPTVTPPTLYYDNPFQASAFSSTGVITITANSSPVTFSLSAGSQLAPTGNPNQYWVKSIFYLKQGTTVSSSNYDKRIYLMGGPEDPQNPGFGPQVHTENTAGTYSFEIKTYVAFDDGYVVVE